jgi:type IV secretion system protein VirB6
LYATLYTAFMGKFDAAVASMTTLSSSVSAAFVSMVTLYILVWGYLVATGKVQDLLSDVAGRMLRLAIIAALVLNVGTYNSVVGTAILQTIPCWAIGAVGGASCGGGNAEAVGASLAGSADVVFTAGMTGAANALGLFSFTSSSSWIFLLVAVACLAAGIISSVVVFFEIVLVLAKVSILVVIGPIFIVFGLFDRTSHLMMGWVNACAHALVEVLLIAVASQVLVGVMAAGTPANGSAPAWVQALAMMIAILVSMGLFLIVPSLAGAITGGGGVLTSGIVAGSVGRQVGAAASVAGTGGRGAAAAGGGVSGVASWVGRRFS